MARNNAVRSLRRKGSKRLMRAQPLPASPRLATMARCANVARAKGLPAVITPEEVRGAA
jgi:hypothetical protein